MVNIKGKVTSQLQSRSRSLYVNEPLVSAFIYYEQKRIAIILCSCFVLQEHIVQQVRKHKEVVYLVSTVHWQRKCLHVPQASIVPQTRLLFRSVPWVTIVHRQK